ncbi:MAG TPA: hypothetical protein VG056_11095 [Pirellulales bacterium]|nr:hypothetical protein [Pirellulales bacterium]
MIRKGIAILWPLAGIALVTYGAWLYSHPAAPIVAGLLMIADSLHSTRQRKDK